MSLLFSSIVDYFGRLNGIGVFVKAIVRIFTDKTHKFVRAIVALFSKMMDDLMGLKVSADNCFNNKTMLVNINSFCVRMIRKVGKNISSVNCFSSFPLQMIFSRNSFFEFRVGGKVDSFFTLRPRSHTFLKTSRVGISFFASKPTDMADASSIPEHVFAHFFSSRNGCFSSNVYFMSFFERHKYLQIKKAVFSGLSKTVKFSRLLTARIQDIKNPLSIDGGIIV